MSGLWLLPFVAQAGLMGVDELWFHRRRGLPRWERIGHPIDTASVFVCWGVAACLPWTMFGVWLFVGLAGFSCLLVTKDEFVHAQRCAAVEHWIHAALFVLHPVVLGICALLWSAREGQPLARAVADASGLSLPSPGWAGVVLGVQAALVGSFGVYQAVYWQRRVGVTGSVVTPESERT